MNPVEVPIRGKDATKPAFDSAIKNADTFAGKLKASLLNPLNVVQGAIIATVATIGTSLLGAVKGFARASVESAASAEAAWGRVEVAVTNAGVNFDHARGKLDRLFTSIQNTTRYSDDDAADAFATLVRVSGDYTSSLQNLALVTDIAAAKKIDLATAAELVGKVMAGETGGLKKFGVVVREGEDAMVALRRQFTGFAERDAATLQGQLAQIANAWDNVKEAIGRALTKVDGAGKSTNVLVDNLNKLGTWIDDNKADLTIIVELLAKAISLMATIEKGGFKAAALILDPSGSVLRSHREKTVSPEKVEFQSVADYARSADPEGRAQAARDAQTRAENGRKAREEAAKKADEEQAKRIADLKHEYEMITSIGKLGLQTEKEKAEALGRQARIAHELLDIATDKRLSMANRSSAADFVAGQRDEEARLIASFGDMRSVPGSPSIMRQRFPLALQVHTRAPSNPSPTSRRGTGDDIADVFTRNMGGEDAFAGVEASLDSLDNRMKNFTGNTLSAMFGVWQDGIQDVMHEHNVMGRVLPGIMRKAIGAGLAADAQDTMLRAAKALALALTDPSGVHALQAGKLFAIGSAELAAASALSGGGGRGGSFGGGGISAGGFSQSQSDMGNRGKVSVVLKGKVIDFNDPDSLAALAAALRELGETRDIEYIRQD